MTRFGFTILRLTVLTGALTLALPALAGYPLTGKWTYDDVDGKGPAKICSKRQMEFAGEQRFDSEGGVHAYRNVRVEPNGAETWRITDEFVNGQVRGRVTFTVTRADEDHINIKMAMGNGNFRLRRCA
jgi:hypothetical protein